MSLLDRLFGKRPDPTEGWAIVCAPLPDFDLTEMRFGSLQFGDTIDAAAFLGRPDRVKWAAGDHGELIYGSSGFLLEFEAGEFAYLAFFFAPDDHLPTGMAIKFAEPRLRGGAAEGARLSGETARPTLEQIFGTADMVDTEPDETVLTYTRKGITMEFELDGETGRLKRWNLYPE
jgi:hypothetical protein